MKVENGVIELYFVNTEYLLADLFTKALGRDRIEFLINKLGMRSFTPETLKQLTDEVDESIDITIDQQVAMDEALVPYARRLRIGRSNFRLLSDISSKESTLQLLEMLHICPRIPGQSFVEPPFKEEILAFLWFLGHSGAIRRKSSGYDSLQLSQAQILWGLYHKRNVDFAYLMWEDFVYQVEHKDTKKSNEMYYPRNSDAYKEYYAVATGATPPKPKASVRKTRSSSDTTVTPPTAAIGPRLNESEEEISWNSTNEEGGDDDDKGDDGDDGEEGNDDDDDDAQDDDDQEEERNDKDDQEEGSDDEQPSDKEEFIHPSLSTHAEEETRDEESFDHIPKTPKNTDDEGNGKENLGTNVGREKGHDEEDEEDELYRDVNINLGRGVQMAYVHTTQESKDSHTPDAGMESIFETTSQMDVQTLTPMAPLHVSAPTLTPSTIATITTTQQAPTPPTTAPSTIQQDLPNFGSLFGFDHRLKTLEANFSKFMQTNQFARAVSSIFGIVQRYMDQQMNEATVNEQLEAEVLTRSSNSSKTSYVIAADLSEMELKKILIEKMEGNKDVVMMMRIKTNNPPLDQTGGPRDVEKERSQTSESTKAEEPMQTTFEMEEPSHPEFDIGSDDQPIVEPSHIQPWISELAKQSDSRSSFNELMDTPVDFSAFLMNQLKVDTLTSELLAAPTYELMKGSCKSLVELEFFLEEFYKATTDQLDWVNPEGQQYPYNMLKPLPLIPNSREQMPSFNSIVRAFASLGHDLDEFIKSGVENLIPILNQIEDFSESNKEFFSIDDDSFSIDSIDYVEASPPDSVLISSEVIEIVISETKSSSTSLNSLLEETNTFDNSLPEFETFFFDVEEISSGSTTTPLDISLLEYEVFYDDHVKEINSGSPTTPFDSPVYASFIFDLSINLFPPADRSDFYEFTDELIPFIYAPEYDCFLFKLSSIPGFMKTFANGFHYLKSSLSPLFNLGITRRVIPFDHFINNELEYLRGGASSSKYTIVVTKTKAADYGHIKWIEDLVPRTMWIQEPESTRDVYSKSRIIAITELKIVEWHNYKHLDWITVRRDDDKLYKFKDGDFKRLRISRHRGYVTASCSKKADKSDSVESYQKKLNLTKPDTYRSDLKRKEAYIAYSNPRGFIYHNKDKQNRLMRIDELHKFSDGTLTDVRTALDDRLKGIRMKYLPQSIWRKNDKDRAATMI
uniref:Uncharacterized protein n=1 Tax=Tanacetum cinerariifolium TaxID=118510 RepID=A0A6L2NUS9_TANCI|nr:hypothetical protein [Tanacetum cinerariifolium]